MFNDEYSLTQDTVGDFLHFPHGEGIAYKAPYELEWQESAFGLSEQLSCEKNLDWKGLKSLTHS